MTRRQRVNFKRRTIGLDYGTHSTKVVVRTRGDVVGNVISLDDPHENYPVNSSPSAIWLNNHRLYFGTSAIRNGQGIDFGSLKAKLVNTPTDEADRLQEFEFLTTAYLCWILSEILKVDPGLAVSEPIVQLSAPTNHSGDPILSERYLRIANACHNFVFVQGKEIKQGCRYDIVRRWICSLLSLPLPPPDERHFFVMPETIAPVVSLQQEPMLEPGMYMLTDMGASTTEVSLFLVHNESVDNKILCYNDSTEFRGGSDLTSHENLPAPYSARKLKDFLDCTEKQVNIAWFLGYQKDMGSTAAKEKWKSLQFLLTGGATLNPHVVAMFNKINPIIVWPENEVILKVGRHVPSTLKSDRRMDDEDLSKFAVANGLAIERARWPSFYLEDELKPLRDTSSQVVDKVPSYLQVG